MVVETRAQATKMEAQVKQIMVMLAKMDTRNKEMDEKWTQKWKK